MRLLFKLLIIGLIFSKGISAQVPEDSSEYNPGLSLLKNALKVEDFTEAAGYFEQLSNRSEGQWLPFYYAGLCYIRASMAAKSAESKDKLIDQAQTFINKAVQIKSADPEIQVLQAFLYQARIQVNPAARGLNYVQKADASLKKALALDSANPRVYMLMAYNTYYTPVPFGGGAKNALPAFQKAHEKFRNFKPLFSYMPDWGESETLQMIDNCKRDLK